MKSADGSWDRPELEKRSDSLLRHSEPISVLQQKRRDRMLGPLISLLNIVCQTWCFICRTTIVGQINKSDEIISWVKVAFTPQTVENLLNIISTRLEINRQVEWRWIVCWDSVVLHRWSVKLVAALAVHLSMGCVEDVSDAQLPQNKPIIGYRPDDHKYSTIKTSSDPWEPADFCLYLWCP